MILGSKKRLLTILGFCGIFVVLIGLWQFLGRDTVRSIARSSGYDPGDRHGFHPPLVRLIYTSQTRPTSEYTITAYPGCAPPGSKIICQYPDGTEEVAAKVKADGSFTFKMPYEKDPGRLGLGIKAVNQQREVSSSARIRTDYPGMGAFWLEPNERGWLSLTSALMDEQKDLRAWEDCRAAGRVRREKLERWAQSQGKTLLQVHEGGGIPDSLRTPLLDPLTILQQQTVPQDLKIYGYTTTAGEVVTCILLADGSSFAESVQSDGTFSVMIPYQKVRASWEGKFSYVVNITDRQNRLLASTGFGLAAPRWAGWW